MAGRGLEAFASLARVIPEVEKPTRKVQFKEKIFWTASAVIIYLIMAEIPLYGIAGLEGDPFAMMRVIFASERGTLMELGIGPIVTAGLILQLLAGSKIIQIDRSKARDRAVFAAANKVLAIIMFGFQAAVFILGGMYGPLSTSIALLVFFQLLVAGIILILLDELVQKGWGLGSGISLFIVAGVTKSIYWSSFAPIGPAGDGYLVGAILAFFQSIMANNVQATLIRPMGLPDMVGFISMLVIFVILIYAEGIRVDVPISHARFRGFRGSYPIKFFYVSVIPVILASALFANVYFISSILSSRFPNSFLAEILGRVDAVTGQPTGGIVYFLTPPGNLQAVMLDPLRALVYTVLFAGICVVFAKLWVELTGMTSRDVAKQLIGSGVQIPGFRRSEQPIREVLDRYIPVMTVLSGLSVGLIAAVANFFNPFGTGIGILLTTSIIWQYYQLLAKERIEEMYPGLSRLLGRG
ncbi:preprotein translocase subunit SecY [Candidatus Hecatella orcuttiae]|jgi:preprotein translocase SecY subunit|uniref:preprotein translocase subunit SecY n=1 Tax=Candidatus Hecatella orcuttiae TaxID=1935119 RepID=UPI002867C515|nr:preprotein translocase subunit SecY [Candidatus Hecatella orcuttiae]